MNTAGRDIQIGTSRGECDLATPGWSCTLSKSSHGGESLVRKSLFCYTNGTVGKPTIASSGMLRASLGLLDEGSI